MTVTCESGIRFAVPEQVARILDEVDADVTEDVLAAEREIAPKEELDVAGEAVQPLRARARDRGIFVPRMPPDYGGAGLGAIGLALRAHA